MTGLWSLQEAALVAQGLCSWNSFRECPSAASSASKNCKKTCPIQRVRRPCENMALLHKFQRVWRPRVNTLHSYAAFADSEWMGHVFENTCQVLVNADIQNVVACYLWHTCHRLTFTVILPFLEPQLPSIDPGFSLNQDNLWDEILDAVVSLSLVCSFSHGRRRLLDTEKVIILAIMNKCKLNCNARCITIRFRFGSATFLGIECDLSWFSLERNRKVILYKTSNAISNVGITIPIIPILLEPTKVFPDILGYNSYIS